MSENKIEKIGFCQLTDPEGPRRTLTDLERLFTPCTRLCHILYQTLSNIVPVFVTPCTRPCHTLCKTLSVSHLVPEPDRRTLRDPDGPYAYPHTLASSERSEQKAGRSPAFLRVCYKKFHTFVIAEMY